jgi:hypothetical protein
MTSLKGFFYLILLEYEYDSYAQQKGQEHLLILGVYRVILHATYYVFLNLKQIEATTDYFPFEVDEDKPNDAIILTRTLKGEEIFVYITMPDDEETKNESTSSSLDDNAKEEDGETDAGDLKCT